ncbi:MAG: hypothetical protein ABIL09_20030, partial [Gemmatimonadota bacterium]
MNQAAYDREVAYRANLVLAAAAARPMDMWSAHAHLRQGRGDRELLHQAIERSLAAPHLGRSGGAGPFHVLPAALLLCRWEWELRPASVDLIRRAFCEGVTVRGNTENHWLMYYAGNLLAAERWADQPVLFNGQPPAVIRAEATRWILGTIERTARLGHHEYDSPQYHMEHLAAYIGLYEHARDPHLRDQVGKVLTVLIADMALEYCRGSWAGGHSREGYRQNTWTRVGPVQTLQYLYFGGEDFNPEHHLHHYAIPAVVAAYRPPPVLAAIALDRSQPHVVRKTRAPRTIIRHTDRDARPVRKYTYMSRSFALGSTQLGLPGPPAGPIDLVSWDLTWHGPKHHAKISCNHPYVHPGRFSAFLGPLPQSARRAVGDDKPYLQRLDRLFGASPYERMMQHEGTIVVLYHIPPDDEAPFVNLFLPRSVDWVTRRGWLLADLGSFFVAVRPIGPFTWERIRESASDGVMVTEGDQIDGWLLRLADPSAGLVLEAVEADGAGSFRAYCERRSASDVDLAGWPAGGRVAVTTHAGVRLEMSYDGPHRVDGHDIDYDAWPLVGAPGATAVAHSGRATYRHGGDEVQVDFGLDPDRPMIPMRVIG